MAPSTAISHYCPKASTTTVSTLDWRYLSKCLSRTVSKTVPSHQVMFPQPNLSNTFTPTKSSA